MVDFLFVLCVQKVLIANVMMLMETCWKEEVGLLFGFCLKKVLDANVMMLMETCWIWKREELAWLNHLEYQEGKEGSW